MSHIKILPVIYIPTFLGQAQRMDEITAKYSRFNILVNKILVDTKKELPQEAKEFLAKPIPEFIGTLKVLQKQGLNVMAIEALISEKLCIKTDELPAHYYGSLRRYLEYFCMIANIL